MTGVTDNHSRFSQFEKFIFQYREKIRVLSLARLVNISSLCSLLSLLLGTVITDITVYLAFVFAITVVAVWHL